MKRSALVSELPRQGEEPVPFALVAIPANDEAERIGACLAALMTQRDRFGAPVEAGRFEVLVYANNCVDGTADAVRTLAEASPHPIHVVTETLPRERANAGWARKRAMDLAATRLEAAGRHRGVILTTDADSCVASTWISATFEAFAGGADCVAGYIDAHPSEIVRLGSDFLHRGRLEDRYLRAMAEIYARCDPKPHDPWPNHRVSSGASLGVTLAAYLSIGGLPPRPVGEDAALTHALECAGFKVRHAMDVWVSTSCRFDGRAQGGAADTMRHRHGVMDAPCDDEVEPALNVVRRAVAKGTLRRLGERGMLERRAWAARFGLAASEVDAALAGYARFGFEEFWVRVSDASPLLRRGGTLRPSDLPRQIERAEAVLAHLRRAGLTRGSTADRGDTSRPAGPRASVAA